MNQRPLNSDQLGEKGELAVRGLLNDAGLTCNKPDRDRTGWDILVEFPFPEARSVPMDARPQPPLAWVQVKTVWAGASGVKMRLSAAERLAKRREPACILVPEVDDRTLAVTRIYGIHIIGEALSRILRRIRELEAAGATRINKEDIRLPYRELGRELEVSGVALKGFLLASLGSDMDTYTKDKERQLATLGVNGPRYSGKFTLEASNMEEVTDVLLGLKKGRMTSFAAEETRWGIRLPMKDATGAGEVQFTPHPRRGELVLRGPAPRPGGGAREVATLPVDVRVPPLQPSSQAFVVRVSNPNIEMLVRHDQFDVSICADAQEGSRLTIDGHLALVRAQRVLAAGGGTVEVRIGGKRMIGAELSDMATNYRTDQLVSAEACLQRLRALAALAGGRDVRASTMEINANVPIVACLHDMREQPGEVRFEPLTIMSASGFPDDLESSECLVVGRMRFGDAQIAWCALGTADISGEGTTRTLSVHGLHLRQVDVLDRGEPPYTDFKMAMQEEMGLRLLLEIGDQTADVGDHEGGRPMSGTP